MREMISAESDTRNIMRWRTLAAARHDIAPAPYSPTLAGARSQCRKDIPILASRAFRQLRSFVISVTITTIFSRAPTPQESLIMASRRASPARAMTATG